ncbi:erythromycin esterase family protein [Streptomyces sp. NBC_01283]|uniref:erythromycin esterase family protein n=1 Tax=Streptomyces sp. NBC_01283 TaxID=2903812 RepID=UPI00352D5ABE|nr:erythromycin esterase family protein [Streptomyces sp. NBC_01283]
MNRTSEATTEAVTEAAADWLDRHAHPLDASDPLGELEDLRPLAGAVAGAEIVALGVGSRATRELSVLQHRMLRFLVEEQGFRSLVLEGEDPARLGLDAYVLTGAGDPEALLSEARSFLRTQEILGVLRWLRAHNERNPHDPVQLAALPMRSLPPGGGLAEIERALADDTIRWYERTRQKTVYWGGLTHTAVGNPRTVSSPAPQTHRNAGGYLREHFGDGYASIGLTFHHGTEYPVPPADFAEAMLGATDLPAYFLDLRDLRDLRAGRPASVDAWLGAPARTRLVGPFYDAREDADHHLSGGSLAEWFDAVVHVREVTPVRALTDTVRRG